MAATLEIRMLTNMAGSGRDENWEVGKTYKVEKQLAERLIEREMAEPVETKKKAAKAAAKAAGEKP